MKRIKSNDQKFDLWKIRKKLNIFSMPKLISRILIFFFLLENQIYYNRRQEYISLIERYVTHEIDSFVLRVKFFQIRREDSNILEDLEKNFERLSNVVIDSKSAKFSPLLEDITSACEYFDFDSEDDERKFRADIEKIFLEMKPYKDSKKFEMDDSFERLKERMKLILISLLAGGILFFSIDFLK